MSLYLKCHIYVYLWKGGVGDIHWHQKKEDTIRGTEDYPVVRCLRGGVDGGGGGGGGA